MALLSRRSPRYAALLEGWRPTTTTRDGINDPFLYAPDLPAVYEDALDFTGFALDQFRERADRDDVALVILSTQYMGTRGDLGFDRMAVLAESRGIPVIDYNDYVLRQGADRRQYGFDNLDFYYGGYASLVFSGKCIAKRQLPDYPIVRVRTGQFTPDDGHIWQAEFPIGAVEGGPLPSTAAP